MGWLSLTTTPAGSIIRIASVGTVVVPFTALFLALGDNRVALPQALLSAALSDSKSLQRRFFRMSSDTSN
jgi:hypothetical protein